MGGLVVVVAPPFIVLGSTLIKFFVLVFQDSVFQNNVAFLFLLLKLLFSAVWECILFFVSVFLLEVYGPIPPDNMLLLVSLPVGWTVLFSAFALYPNLLFFRKDVMLLGKRIQRALILGLIAPMIAVFLYIYLLGLA